MRLCFQVSLVLLLSMGAIADIRISPGCCAMSREMPQIDKYGCAVEPYRLGSFMLGDTAVPLYAYWTSAASSSQTMLGYGWHIPWLECRMIPMDATRYRLDSPFGDTLDFVKDAKSDSELYRFRRGACAKIAKGIAKVYCQPEPTPIPDMIFSKGRLVQFRYASKVFNLVYEDGCFRAMMVGGRTVLSVERIMSRNDIKIYFNGQRRGCATVFMAMESVCIGYRSDGPIFENRNIVTGLHTVAGNVLRFSYGVSGKNGRISDGRTEVFWDLLTRKIVSNGDWTYDVSENDPDRGIYKFRRENTSGEVEAYSYDLRSGIREREVKGVHDVCRLFTSGNFRGMRRWNERRSQGMSFRKEYSYDENGRLAYCRYIERNKGTYNEYWYDINGRICRSRMNGDDATLIRFKYSPDGLRTIDLLEPVDKEQKESVR